MADSLFGEVFSKGGGRFLDVGCGMGLACVWAAQHFDTVDGCDLDQLDDAFKTSEPAVRVGAQIIDEIGMTNARLFAGDVAGFLSERKEHYDVLFSHFVLEHVEHLEELCALMFGALKSGGFSFHIVPNTHDTVNQLLVQNLVPIEENENVLKYLRETNAPGERMLKKTEHGWYVPITHSEFISDYRAQFEVNSSEHFLFPLMESGFKVRDIKPMREHSYGILLEKI